MNLPKDVNQWRLKYRIPDERKYVIYSHNLNTLIKAPSVDVTAFSVDPTPMFNSYHSSESLPSTSYHLAHHNSSCCSNWSQPESVEKNSVAIQTEIETWYTQTDCRLTASLWSSEFAIVVFEQQNKNLLIELNSFRCANRSRANAKANADRAESKLEIPEKVTSDLFEENKEVKQQLEEATSKAESLQSELLEAKKMNILLKQKLDDYDLAKKRFDESVTKKNK